MPQDRKNGMTDLEKDAILSAHERKADDLGRIHDNVPLDSADLCGSCQVIWDRRNPSGCPKCSSVAASVAVTSIWKERGNESS